MVIFHSYVNVYQRVYYPHVINPLEILQKSHSQKIPHLIDPTSNKIPANSKPHYNPPIEILLQSHPTL
jgi:hypothetical protein